MHLYCIFYLLDSFNSISPLKYRLVILHSAVSPLNLTELNGFYQYPFCQI